MVLCLYAPLAQFFSHSISLFSSLWLDYSPTLKGKLIQPTLNFKKGLLRMYLPYTVVDLIYEIQGSFTRDSADM